MKKNKKDLLEANIENLLAYALEKSLILEDDKIITRNNLYDLFNFQPVNPPENPGNSDLETILETLLEYAVSEGLINDTITEKDLFDTRIMGFLTPRNSFVVEKFKELQQKSGEEATSWFYNLCIYTDYIRNYRIAKNSSFSYKGKYGDLQITINLAKPEKDPKEIAKLKELQTETNYPKCVLCKENMGFSGNLKHPARQNLRMIPLKLNNEKWYYQFSPYVYYNEHSIILSEHHTPMKISRETFKRLLEFTEQFPHYFIGSNADLPIVGGSILNHDHFQGGCHQFPMEKASVLFSQNYPEDKNIELKILKWPLSVIRLSGSDQEKLVNAAENVLNKWKGYSDQSADIIAFTNETSHNTITPICRKKGDNFELDLVLRNNRTTETYPDGIFHPHKELHHIKKENIGLIEVMGLAILPGRLKNELDLIKKVLIEKEQSVSKYPELEKHQNWLTKLQKENLSGLSETEVDGFLEKEIGLKFEQVLEDAGVFKQTNEGLKQFKDFINTL